MTTIHTSPPPGPGFSIYEDSEHGALDYDADTSFNSETSSLPCADDPIASIEHPDDAFAPSPRSSSHRRISALTTTSLISELPSELSITSRSTPRDTHHYTPMKERPLFRNPSSVRALQMASPPPFEAYSSPRASGAKGPYKLSTPSRRSETPSRHSARSQSLKPGQTPTPSKQQVQSQQHYPLVLLHVTLLPLSHAFSPSVMAAAAPGWLGENFRLLEEKFMDSVLMQRGILIPHPKEEYDLLEERLLESLELKMPRLLKCGHFTGGDEEGDDLDVSDSENEGRGSRMSGGTITAEDDMRDFECEDDGSVCTDCHRPVKKPGKGAGSGTKRWDIKIYAANGLMRAGAWAAAWSEMERVDVEISPWIPEDIRKALERRQKEEEREELLERKRLQDEEETRKAEALLEEKKRYQAERKAEEEAAATAFEEKLRREEEEAARRLASIPTILPSEEYAVYSERPRSRSKRPRSTSSRQSIEEIPLSILLRNYVYLLASDRRNIVIFLLSAFVLFLSLQLNKPHSGLVSPASDIHELLLQDPPQECSASSIIITTTSIVTQVAAQNTPTKLAETSLSASSSASTPSILASEQNWVSEAPPVPTTSSESLVGSPSSETAALSASHAPSEARSQPAADASAASSPPPALLADEAVGAEVAAGAEEHEPGYIEL